MKSIRHRTGGRKKAALMAALMLFSFVHSLLPLNVIAFNLHNDDRHHYIAPAQHSEHNGPAEHHDSTDCESSPCCTAITSNFSVLQVDTDAISFFNTPVHEVAPEPWTIPYHPPKV